MGKVVYKEIPENPGYRVGSDGSVWSRNRRGVVGYNDHWLKLKPRFDELGYPRIRIIINKNRRDLYVARLVLRIFKGPPPTPKHECCHFPDPTPRNVRADNLIWGTRKENAGHAVKQGRTARGENNGRARFTDKQVKQFRRLYKNGNIDIPKTSKKLGISKRTIMDAIQGISYRYVK